MLYKITTIITHIKKPFRGVIKIITIDISHAVFTFAIKERFAVFIFIGVKETPLAGMKNILIKQIIKGA
ncbi:hypothetical protein AU512_05730 [Lonsdalea iberica]|uniref:Transposase n=1 Tax=Lonsdalea iberica TaxID=1082703 RepID=A0ABX3XIA4_9GAMM|nr:hypothetical protein AU512_05730 [Lonsdalea iberica]